MEHLKAFLRRRGLLLELVKKGIKLKYRKSYLGLFWSFLEPLMTTAVLTLVFGTLLGRGERNFPLYILCGRLLYSFFASSTKAASRSIKANSSMIRKVYVPKYLYPLSSVLANYVTTGISLLTLIPLCIYCREYPTWRIFTVVLPFLLLFLLTYGCGMILATITVFFRDMEYIWDVVCMLIMYASAIMYYPEKILKRGYGWILRYNPLYCIITNFRAGMFGEPIQWDCVWIAAAYGIILSIVGTWLFYKKQDDFILAI